MYPAVWRRYWYTVSRLTPHPWPPSTSEPRQRRGGPLGEHFQRSNIGSWKGWAVHEELKAMGPFGLSIMGAAAKKTVPAHLRLFNMDLRDFHLGNGGRLLYDFLGIGDIPAEEINVLIEALRELPPEPETGADL